MNIPSIFPAIKTLDCSGKTGYLLGTIYQDETGEQYKFTYNPGVTQQDILTYQIQPAFISLTDPDKVIVCGAKIKEKGNFNFKLGLGLLALIVSVIIGYKFFKP